MLGTSPHRFYSAQHHFGANVLDICRCCLDGHGPLGALCHLGADLRLYQSIPGGLRVPLVAPVVPFGLEPFNWPLGACYEPRGHTEPAMALCGLRGRYTAIWCKAVALYRHV